MAERYPHSASPQSLDLLKYLWRFIGAYLVLAILVGTISVLFELNSISALSAVVILASAQFAGHLFHKDHHRVPEKSEKRRFGLYGMGFSLLIAILPFGFLIYMKDVETMVIVETLGYVGLSLTLLVSAGLAYFLSAFGFGQGAKLATKAFVAKEKRLAK